MKVEQNKDDELLEIRSMIRNGKETKDVQKHYGWFGPLYLKC